MGTCFISDCNREVYAKFLCEMHYQRQRKFGDPNIVKKEMRSELPKPIILSDHALIPLTKGLFAKIDLVDVEYISKFFWHAAVNGKYAARREGTKIIYMHQEIAGKSLGLEPDHENRDSLDNRRTNLILKTHQENIQNSGFVEFKTGVSVDRTNNRFKAYIGSGKDRINLGTFRSREEAELAVKRFTTKE